MDVVDTTTKMLVAAFALVGGYVALIPAFTNFAGAFMGGVIGGAQKLRKQGTTLVNKGQKEKRERVGSRILQRRAQIRDTLQAGASNVDASRGGRFVRRVGARAVGGRNIEAHMSARRATVGKEVNDQIATGRDEEVRGLTVNRGVADTEWDTMARRKTADGIESASGLKRETTDGRIQYRSLGGAWVDDAHVRAGQKRWGRDSFAQQAALSYEMRKASSEDELQGLAQRYSQTAKGQWARTDEQSAGIWMGAAFENQNKHLEFKRTDWRTGQLSDGGRRAFVDEIYENRGSYNLAQMNSNTIEQLKGTHDHYEAIVANKASTNQQRDEALDQMGKIRSVSETFMHELGGGSGGATAIAGGTPGAALGTPGAGGSRQSSTPGAAHVAERVRELQDVSHNYKAGPSGFYDPGHAPTANRKEHR